MDGGAGVIWLRLLTIFRQMFFFVFYTDFQCPDKLLKCGDGMQCLRYYQFCDGDVDCHDGSDENEDFCRGWFSFQLTGLINTTI